MKVILSTGQGRLHLFQSAVSLKKAGVKIKVISGWMPGKNVSDGLINKLGKLTGRNNLADGLRKRRPQELAAGELKSCSISEFALQALFKLSSYRLLKRTDSAVIGWRLFGWQSRRFIKDADIFHVRSGAGCGGAIRKAKRLGMKVIVDHSIAHPKELERQLNKSVKTGKLNYNRYLTLSPSDKFWDLVLDDCLNADCLLVNSEYVKWSFVKEGYPEDRIRIAQLGVNPEFNSLKSIYSSAGKIRLIFTGGFGSRKGAALIIGALQILSKKNIEFSLDVVGSVMNDITIPDWFRKSPSIKLHGYLPQEKMKPLLEQSDIYIFPTYAEGAAQSVKEAMSVGLPVITTRQSGSPIINGENGILIEDDSVEALTEAIIYLGHNIALQEKLGRNAAQTIRENHTWEKFAFRTMEVYRELLSE